MLTFFDFPGPHWRSIRTTNTIESVFATVKLRTHKTRGCLSLSSAETIMFKLMKSAQKRGIRLNGAGHTAKIIRGADFTNGVAATNKITPQQTINEGQTGAA